MSQGHTAGPPGAPTRPGRPRGPRRLIALGAALLAMALLAACGATDDGSTTTASCGAGATRLTFWGWPAGYDLAVEEFNRTHPDICVQLENAGATTAEYVKLNNALKAGSGAPDVATIEYFELPSFEITHSLVDLAPYGVGSVRDRIAPAAWAQVTRGAAQYAMPVDLGPLALYYNSRELTAHHIPVPATWSQFAAAAATLHTEDPKAALTNFDAESPQDVLALMQQDGAFPFHYDGGDTLGVDFTGKRQMAFAAYWQKLIDAHEVTTATDFSPAQWSDLDTGATVARLSPAWGPVGMQQSITKTVGDWRAAPMPQAEAGQEQSGNWGGSALAVVKGTRHARQAAEFVKWFGASADAWKILSGKVAGAFPGYLPLLDSPAFRGGTLPISAGSHPNEVFAQAAQHMTAAQWPPIMTAALTQWTSTFAAVSKGTGTLAQAFAAFQKQMVAYARDQGFTVTED
ncbi:extracellular solute-binding protein [Streptomyces sp. PTM05]|uniref:Extracellular solute-binding protein n=1 Tax=Streptantibioticus parmotrematis TaxID=2873249 RepID=A0ABS7QSB8_9ACTN|nr:extracellular solute-binding protein [Streptantibioticus parmotrematis]MBY8886085.1 extracellular solute-binding protein [Streptantibioticus parmotrematis]